jgi:hypothetical protein
MVYCQQNQLILKGHSDVAMKIVQVINFYTSVATILDWLQIIDFWVYKGTMNNDCRWYLLNFRSYWFIHIKS